MNNIKKFDTILDCITAPCYIGSINDNNFDESRVNINLNCHMIVDNFNEGNFIGDNFKVTKLSKTFNFIIFDQKLLDVMKYLSSLTISLLKIFEFLSDKITIFYCGYYKICPHIMGGFGNQLYQVSAAIAFSIKHNYKLIFDSSHMDKQTLHYSNTILDVYPKLSNMFSREVLTNYKIYREKQEFVYNEIDKIYPILVIYGYFQGTKYFENIDVKELFKDFITLPKEIKNAEITIHVRRGDFLKNPHIFTVLNPKYYEDALKLLPDGDVLIISEDLQWCKDNLKISDRNVKYQYKDYISDFLSLSNSTKGMILAGSTFSWWAAYLNPHKNVTIVCPDNWYSQQKSIDISKIYYQDNWKIVHWE